MNREQGLRERVLEAAAAKRPLDIAGGGSKAFLGRLAEGERLDVTHHRGILDYEPRELVITARCGTPLAEIETTLAERNQMLPFEPPHFADTATLGGCIATGLSGPRRPYSGAARDLLLGVRLLNGRGEILRFGGAVMKNVAGYDIPRLMCGAMGTLGVLLEVSLKVLPLPSREITLVYDESPGEALRRFNDCAGRPLPLSAACHDGKRSYLRLSGAESAVAAARKALGGELLETGEHFWRTQVREQGHRFFRGEAPLWRLSLPPAAPWEPHPGDTFIDWGGALRWIRSERPAEVHFSAAAAAGGHASLFRGGDRRGQRRQPLPKTVMTIQHRLKQAFDPQGLFNPGRLYREF